MAESRGTYGRLKVFEDFLGAPEVTAMATVAASAGNIGYVCTNEGTMRATVDEDGGVWAFTTDTADNDNFALYAGPFKPSNGGCFMEARFKVADITKCAVYCGFSETLDAANPVCPAEYATTTLTVNGTGGMVGALWDSDGTSDYWMAVAGDGGEAATGAPAVTSQAAVNDEYDVVRVEIGADGKCDVYLAAKGGILTLIKSFDSPITTSDLQHAVLLIENRAAAASVMEVDYFYAEGGRDWTR